MGQFTLSAQFDCSAAILREFLGVISNFPLITDPDLEIEIIESPVLVAADAEIAFSLITGGFRQVLRHRWTTVTETQIVAEQIMGPTKFWIHDQTISASENGCTLQETIDFEPPGGMLGFVFTENAIMESLNNGTAIRHELLAEQLIAEQSA
jgi:ligand-binding SRPBCC domain-containing protein